MEKNRYLEEIEDLKRQLQRANEKAKHAEEVDELSHQLQRANQENQELREEHRKMEQERDQALSKN